ncbi:MAG: glycine cleavage system protein GcvH [Spirochaetia bacterium]
MRLYTKDHTWVEADGLRARVGLSDFAQSELGDIAYVELPESGARVIRGEVMCTVDSLKSSSEIYAPVSGVVVDVNPLLRVEENCALVNRDPLGQGWLVVIEMQDADELKVLLAEEEYGAYTRGA